MSLFTSDPFFAYNFHGLGFGNVPGLAARCDRLPDGAFYTALYDRLQHFAPAVGFRLATAAQGWLIADLLATHLAQRLLLSWGAGLGVIERDLAAVGWQIDAVEVMKVKGWPAEVGWYSALADVPPGQYDAVMTVSTLYSQIDSTAEQLLYEFAGRVCPGGVLLIAEQDARSAAGALRGIVARRLVHRRWRYTPLWGCLRVPHYFVRHTPMRHTESRFFAMQGDLRFRRIVPPRRLLGRQLLVRRSKMFFHLFRKD